MAEDDWYGPFGGLLKNGPVLVLLVAGAAMIVAGLLGYDMSRKAAGEPRWHDGPFWGDVLVGVAVFAGGVYGYRRMRAKRSRARAKGETARGRTGNC